MRIRPLAVAVLAVLGVLATATATATAAPPAGFQTSRTVAADLQVERVAAAPSAIAYLDGSGDVWATRVRADGTLGSPLPAAQAQRFPSDLQVVVTDRGELVVLWTVGLRTHGEIRYAVAPAGRSFSGAGTLANVPSSTGAAPRMAALRGGTVAVVYRDRSRPTVLRYARRPPGGTFGQARSLGHDGVGPEIEASPGGGALLAPRIAIDGDAVLIAWNAQGPGLLPGPNVGLASIDGRGGVLEPPRPFDA